MRNGLKLGFFNLVVMGMCFGSAAAFGQETICPQIPLCPVDQDNCLFYSNVYDAMGNVIGNDIEIDPDVCVGDCPTDPMAGDDPDSCCQPYETRRVPPDGTIKKLRAPITPDKEPKQKDLPFPDAVSYSGEHYVSFVPHGETDAIYAKVLVIAVSPEKLPNKFKQIDKMKTRVVAFGYEVVKPTGAKKIHAQITKPEQVKQTKGDYSYEVTVIGKTGRKIPMTYYILTSHKALQN